MDTLGDILRERLQLNRTPGVQGQPPGAEPPGAALEAGCPVCQGTGWVRHEVPLDHPDFGRLFPCQCQRLAFEAQRLERLQRYSNLGPLTRVTFASLGPAGPKNEARAQERYGRALQACQAYAQQPQGWLLLCGPGGTGKTHLAAALANRCLEDGRPALFVSVPDLLDHLRAAYSPSSEVAFDELFEQVRTAPLLLLDDLGAQGTTPWAREKLMQLFNSRAHARLPTVITTDAALDELEEAVQARLQDPSLCQALVLGPAEGRGLEGMSLGDLALLKEMTFATFECDLPGLTPPQKSRLDRAYRAAVRFAEEPSGWLVFAGAQGTGKTHLAAAVANFRRLEGKPVLFVVVPDLLDHFRAAFGPDSRVAYDTLFEQVRSCPLLILDDLSTQGATPWAREKLYQLLNYRYNARLPTVVTTASGLGQAREESGTRSWREGERFLDERIGSRLKDRDLSEVHDLSDVPNYRERFAGRGRDRRRRANRAS